MDEYEVSVHGLMDVSDPRRPLVWCRAEEWGSASMDERVITCPACLVEKGLAEWSMI